MNPALLTCQMKVAITIPDRFCCYIGIFTDVIDRPNSLDDVYYRFSVSNVPSGRFVLTAIEVERWVQPV